MKNANTILVMKYEDKEQLRRIVSRRRDNIKMDLKEILLNQHDVRLRVLVNAAIIVCVPFGILAAAERLSASQGGLCSVELVSLRYMHLETRNILNMPYRPKTGLNETYVLYQVPQPFVRNLMPTKHKPAQLLKNRVYIASVADVNSARQADLYKYVLWSNKYNLTQCLPEK
jgi:hypothetical protein